jgi:hypothetical protein
MVCITANILLSNSVAHLVDQVMNPRNDEEGYYDYDLEDDNQEGVPWFEGAASAPVRPLRCVGLLWTGNKCVCLLSCLTRMLGLRR